MAKAILPPELIGISGKLGNVIFKTYKNGQVRVYKAPDYQRKKTLSDAEIQARQLFHRRAKRAAELIAHGIPKQEAWTIAKSEIH